MKRSISARLNRSVGQVRARRRALEALRFGLPTAGIAAFAWICVQLAVSVGLAAPEIRLPAAVAAFGITLGLFLLGFFRLRLPTVAVVREIDRRVKARGRLIASAELGADDSRFAVAAREDADEWARHANVEGRVRRWFPMRLPDGASRSVALIALAPVAALVLSGTHLNVYEWLTPRSSSTQIVAQQQVASLLAAAEQAELPTLTWTVEQLEARRAPEPTPTPFAIGAPDLRADPRDEAGNTADPTKKPVVIMDAQARAFVEALTSPTMRARVQQEIGVRYTGDLAPPEFEMWDIRASMTEDIDLSGQPMPEDERANKSPFGRDNEAFQAAGAGFATGAKVDPVEFKHDYIKDRNTLSELVKAMKGSFNQYLKEFSDQVLDGLKDGMTKGLTGKDISGRDPRDLPSAPRAGKKGPLVAQRGDAKPTAYVPGTPQMTGGTAAGGVGAGTGTEGQAGSAPPISSQPAAGPRIDLHGTLSERLAVIDIVQKMNSFADGGVYLPADPAAAELVKKITKEAEAADTADVPADYQRAVAAYFQALSQPPPAE